MLELIKKLLFHVPGTVAFPKWGQYYVTGKENIALETIVFLFKIIVLFLCSPSGNCCFYERGRKTSNSLLCSCVRNSSISFRGTVVFPAKKTVVFQCVHMQGFPG